MQRKPSRNAVRTGSLRYVQTIVMSGLPENFVCGHACFASQRHEPSDTYDSPGICRNEQFGGHATWVPEYSSGVCAVPHCLYAAPLCKGQGEATTQSCDTSFGFKCHAKSQQCGLQTTFRYGKVCARVYGMHIRVLAERHVLDTGYRVLHVQGADVAC